MTLGTDFSSSTSHFHKILIMPHMSCVMRKPAFCICENKDADQLRGNREADQRLCFRYTIVQFLNFLNLKFQASSHRVWLYSPGCVRPGRKSRTGFLRTRLISYLSFQSISSEEGLTGFTSNGIKVVTKGSVSADHTEQLAPILGLWSTLLFSLLSIVILKPEMVEM